MTGTKRLFYRKKRAAGRVPCGRLGTGVRGLAYPRAVSRYLLVVCHFNPFEPAKRPMSRSLTTETTGGMRQSLKLFKVLHLFLCRPRSFRNLNPGITSYFPQL